jgi:hypothetical protein
MKAKLALIQQQLPTHRRHFYAVNESIFLILVYLIEKYGDAVMGIQ